MAQAQAHEDHPEAVHAHPTAATYLKVAMFLGVLTIFEVAIYDVELLGPLLPAILVVLAGIKFVTVVMYYMHLKFDGRLMQVLFTGPFFIATFILLTLMALFYQFFTPALHPVVAGGH